MIDLTSKLGEINNIEHNKGSKKYPQNQVILDGIMPSIPLKHKCLGIILIWVIVSSEWSLKKSKNKLFFFILFLIGKKDGYFRLGMGQKIPCMKEEEFISYSESSSGSFWVCFFFLGSVG